MTINKAYIVADWGEPGTTDRIDVQYNPKEFSLEKSLQHGEINIPGLDAPLQQFIRGQAEKLTVELFFDSTEDGMGTGATPVTLLTDRLYRLAKIEDSSHAPPIVTFHWGEEFPGSHLTSESSGDAGSGGNQARNNFVGIVEKISQQFTLFSSEGVPLRATVNLTLREYRRLDEQLPMLRLNSPDKTHSHVLEEGETLEDLAARYYRNPKRWRPIARENNIYDPRRIEAGSIFTVPSIR